MTYQEQWLIGKNGVRESKESMLFACLSDNDDDDDEDDAKYMSFLTFHFDKTLKSQGGFVCYLSTPNKDTHLQIMFRSFLTFLCNIFGE